MCIRKTALRILGAVAGMAVLIVPAIALYHFRPVFTEKGYRATIETPQGGRIPATVYSMWGRPSWLFVRVPETHRDPERPVYRCFLLDTTDDWIAMSWLTESPYLHRKHDQAGGIDLRSSKLEDHWRIERNDRTVQFSNGRLGITVTPR
jgi:hypothetical protein